MIRIWREPEVVVRFGGDSIVHFASEASRVSLDGVGRFDPVPDDWYWFVWPQLNGYNVHDGVYEDVSIEDL